MDLDLNSSNFQVHSLCQNNPCRNKAECKVLTGEEEFVCDCPLGYQGVTCEDRIDVQVLRILMIKDRP